jgi:transposase
LIAEALGVTEAAVSQWLTHAARDGLQALRPRSRRGQGSRLSDEQRRRLPALLERGAEAYGFAGALWTCRRIAEVIEREFGIRYHPSHVSRLLHALRWSHQKPVFRSAERDEAAIASWLTSDWPAIKKKPKRSAEPSSSSTNRGSS